MARLLLAKEAIVHIVHFFTFHHLLQCMHGCVHMPKVGYGAIKFGQSLGLSRGYEEVGNHNQFAIFLVILKCNWMLTGFLH